MGRVSISANPCLLARGLQAAVEGQRLLDYVVSQVELGVDEVAGDGGEAEKLLAEFGEDAVGVSGGGGGAGAKVPSVATARRLLQDFAFPPARWDNLVSKLSGGEKRRLQLLATLAARPNLLVLDEVSEGGDGSVLHR